MSKTISMEVPDELLKLLGSEEEVVKEAKQALVLDLVRRGRISRSKAAELLGINLWDMPKFLSTYEIPWFDYSEEQMRKDIVTLRELEKEVNT